MLSIVSRKRKKIKHRKKCLKRRKKKTAQPQLDFGIYGLKPAQMLYFFFLPLICIHWFILFKLLFSTVRDKAVRNILIWQSASKKRAVPLLPLPKKQRLMPLRPLIFQASNILRPTSDRESSSEKDERHYKSHDLRGVSQDKCHVSLAVKWP